MRHSRHFFFSPSNIGVENLIAQKKKLNVPIPPSAKNKIK